MPKKKDDQNNEEKEIEAAETNASEPVKPVETSEDFLDIKKPTAEDPSLKDKVEGYRQEMVKFNKSSSLRSTISISITLAFLIASLLLMSSNSVLAFIFLGVAIATIIVFTIINQRFKKPDVKGYIANYCMAIDEHIFAHQDYSKMKYAPKIVYDMTEHYGDGIYEGVIDSSSRNTCEGMFRNHSFKTGEVAVFGTPENKKMRKTLFVGRYVSINNDLHYEDHFLLVSKGEQEVDLPNALNGIEELVNEGKFFIFGPSGANVEKVLGKKFISAIKDIQVKDHLMNINIAVWPGKTFVYISYDDDSMTVPFNKPFDETTVEQVKKDMYDILSACALLIKE